jgi:hypothetical protein
VPHWASEDPVVTPVPPRRLRSEPRRSDTMLDPGDPVAAAVSRLRLASVERILREARTDDPALSLGATIERLRALEPRLMWFGRSIVWWEDGS